MIPHSTRSASIAISMLVVAFACRSQAAPVVPAPAPPAVTPATVVPGAAAADSLAARRQRTAQGLLTSLGPRATMPAESVFTNIQIFRGMPAGQVVQIMDAGFGRALGVTCGHCHQPGQWASDAKPQKQIARGMWEMVRATNQQLHSIPNMPATAVVNCTTCHRGSIKPVSDLR